METFNFEAFINLLSDELSIEKSVINSTDDFRSLPNWSSLNALLIINCIHEKTDQLISPVELSKIKTVEEFFQLIK